MLSLKSKGLAEAARGNLVWWSGNTARLVLLRNRCTRCGGFRGRIGSRIPWGFLLSLQANTRAWSQVQCRNL